MKPLEGVKIIDFTQAHAGSLATMILSDFGAEVIKIERAGVGDLARYWEPMKDGNSGYYAYLNRGKKSISLDATSDEGREIIFKLLKDADVICENFKYGSMERMGLSYEEVTKVNPSIIYASLNGYGQTGPMKKAIGLDLQLQAMSGLMDRTGFPDGPPTKVGPAIGDHLSGTYMATAINMALIHKKKTGEGQRIDIAILDSLFSVLEEAQINHSLGGEELERRGNSCSDTYPCDTFKTKDGYISVIISTEEEMREFASIIGISVDKINLKEEIKEAISKISKFEVEKKLKEVGISCGIVKTVSEAMEMDQIKEREMLKTIYDKALGDITIPGTVIKMSKTIGGYTEGSPLLGENSKYYLNKLGYSKEEVEDLVEKKIVEIV